MPISHQVAAVILEYERHRIEPGMGALAQPAPEPFNVQTAVRA